MIADDPGPDPTDLPDPADMTYADAIAELEGIVAELESDSLDVDRLAERVARAAVLVERCRDRIDGARLSVEQILDRLEPDPES